MKGASSSAVTVALTITGMTCAACVSRLERVLGRQPGVVAASVSLPAERAELVFDPALIAVPALVAAVEAAGFGARLEVIDAGPSLESGDEARRTLRLFLVAALLSSPLVLEMVVMLSGGSLGLPGWLLWALATPVQFWAGARFYRGAWYALRGGGANMDVLVALGTSAAYGLSVWQVLNGGDHSGPGYHGQPPQFEAAALVITLVLAGKGLEARARRATNRAVAALVALRPEQARRRLSDGGEELVALGRIGVGDLIVVLPGERIAVDGTVVEGRAAVDEAMITGEAMPRERASGDSVTGGTLNLDGRLIVCTTAVGAAAVLGRMIALVGHAQATKPRIQRLADRVSGWFAFFVAGVALLTFAGWLVAGSELGAALLPAVAVLVVACPCALGLATPAVIAVALGTAARHGILIRDAEALECAHAVDTVVFDKTGTLTEDRPELFAIEAIDGTAEALLALAAAVQRGSAHPIARALADQAAARGLAVPVLEDFRTVAGRGVTGTVVGRALVLGNRALIDQAGLSVEGLAAQAAAHEALGRAVLWIGESAPQPRLLGLFALADRVRPGAAAALAALGGAGIEVVLLTGDAPAAALATAGRLGLTPAQVLAGARPEDKIAEIERRQALGRRVAMVGDGINDGPALARADLGIAMGSGMDVAIEAAGVSLMRPDPALVPALLALARATRHKIIANLVWAFGFNAVALPLAALGWFGPVAAAAAMTVSSLMVVGNALLLQRWQPPGLVSASASASASARHVEGGGSA